MPFKNIGIFAAARGAVVVTPTPTPTPTLTPTPTPSAVAGPDTGFVVAGNSNSTPGRIADVQSFPFASPFTSSTNVGDLNNALSQGGAVKSSTEGFAMGGYVTGTGEISQVDSFPLSSPFTSATDVGNVEDIIRLFASVYSADDGYVVAGLSPSLSPQIRSKVQQFPFSSPFTTSTTPGDLDVTSYQATGEQDGTDGYHIGERTTTSFASVQNNIRSFPFASPFTSNTFVGDLTLRKISTTSANDGTDALVAGGQQHSGAYTTNVDSFPFSSPFTTATDAGDLAGFRRRGAGSSDNTDMFLAGGDTGPGNNATAQTDSFPFSSPFTTSTDVGDLTTDVKQTMGLED